jgi:hypothetical protein
MASMKDPNPAVISQVMRAAIGIGHSRTARTYRIMISTLDRATSIVKRSVR